MRIHPPSIGSLEAHSFARTCGFVRRIGPRLLLAITLLALGASARAEVPADKPAMIVATGAAGDDTYEPRFALWSQQWINAAKQGELVSHWIGQKAGTDDKQALAEALKQQSATSSEPLWIVLVGHGTWDGKEGKFNLRGDDVSAAEMAEWLKPFERPLIIVATFSSSGAWLGPLAAPGRVVLTSTRSGAEENFSRLGEYLPEAFTNPAGDLDKDGQISLLEAWLTAAKATEEFYANEGRLATEHSLLEDNGDGRGTPPDWFQGVRAVKRSTDNKPADGLRAHQIHLIPNPAEKALPAPLRQERDALELEIAKLREAKSTMEEAVYYQRLEELLLKLAKLYAD